MNTDPLQYGQGTKKQDYPSRELMGCGHLACPGCGAAQAMRYALKVLGENTVAVIPACCWSIIAGPFPYSALGIPLMHTAFETAASAASGVRAALDIQGKTDTIVLAWAGDGGTFDIGIQALSAAAERNENIIYVCYDNEAYMNTGIQRSSATPLYAWTTTTPEAHPKQDRKKNIDLIMMAHKIPYVATTTSAHPHDMMEKFKKAKAMKGTRFIHILASCIPGWRIPSELSVEVTRMAVDSKVFPVFEIFDGERIEINLKPKNTPVKEYLRAQGRFKHLTDNQISEIQKEVDSNWEKLLAKSSTALSI
ncbi:MAG: pyruvate synthase subunit beta [Deltaproteobacteria bacterium]|nr:pyruvate synthase subunit beta [Deltaproteobacteria bacterium]